MPRDLFVAVDGGAEASGRAEDGPGSCGVEGGVSPRDSRALHKARTASPRAFVRTTSPKPSRTGGGPGLDMEPLVSAMLGSNVEQAREAASAVRTGLKNSPIENRDRLLAAGGIDALVRLLKSDDPETVECAIGALLTMSLSEGAEPLITKNGGLEAIVEVMGTATPAGREAAAAAVFTLSSSAENKARVRQAGGVPSLVHLLQAGTLRGKKDAALALFNLSLDGRCTEEIVREGGPKVLMDLLTVETDPGLEDKVMAVVANLCKSGEGRKAVHAVDGAIATLVDIADGGSTRSKEDSAVSLFLLAAHLPACTHEIVDEGAMVPLGKLAQSGTPRARSKAKALLELLRSTTAVSSAPQAEREAQGPSGPVAS